MNPISRTQSICAALFLSAAFTGCIDEDTATRALDGAGYTEIELIGYRLYGCSESDDFATGFKAIGPTGRHVSGVVCSGVLKGATIRLD